MASYYGAPVIAACLYCRTKKVRCEGGQPCTQCANRNEQCFIVPPRRRKRRAPAATKSSDITQRLQRLESLLGNSQGVRPNGTASTPPFSDSTSVRRSRQAEIRLPPKTLPSNNSWNQFQRSDHRDDSARQETHLSARSSLQNAIVVDSAQDILSPHSSGISTAQNLHCQAITPSAGSSCITEESSLTPNDMSNWEYNGPRTVLSVFSRPGLDWITSKLPGVGIKESLLAMMTDVTSRLRIGPESSISLRGSAPEPSEGDVNRYCKAFFEDSFEAYLSLVDRTWFMSQLDASFAGNKRTDNYAWYALRNTVFALGSRIYLGRASSYSNAIAVSLSFFENALSVHTDMLHRPTSILAVRALTLMGYFSEGIGSPTIQYTLISEAMRLAISKGLHRQPAKSWGLSDHEMQQRNRLFWAIYSLDRQISSRSGRPHAIGDDDISCELPTPASTPGVDLEFSSVYLKLIRLLSKAHNRLSTARALEQSAQDTVCAIAELDDYLQDYKQSIQYFVDLDESLDSIGSAAAVPMRLLIMLHFLYYEVVFTIHSLLVFPWLSHINGERLDEYHDQVQRSCSAVAEIAKRAILGTTSVQINANTPISLAVYLPLRSTIAIFIAVLKSPKGSTTQSDLILLDVAAGFASRLQFATGGDLQFPLVKNLAQLARAFAESEHVAEPSWSSTWSRTDVGEVDSDRVHGALPEALQARGDDEMDRGSMELDVESWSTFWPYEMAGDINVDAQNMATF